MDLQQGSGLERRLETEAPNIRRALVGWLGPQLGDEAYAEALLFAWANQEKMAEVEHLTPFLFKVGRSRVSNRRKIATGETPRSPDTPQTEPQLHDLLMSLSRRQRTSVVLVLGWQWSYGEVAELLGISKSSVQRHVERALLKLRSGLGVDIDE